MKVETYGTQKSAMPLSFISFDFLRIYKAEWAGSQTYPFVSIEAAAGCELRLQRIFLKSNTRSWANVCDLFCGFTA